MRESVLGGIQFQSQNVSRRSGGGEEKRRRRRRRRAGRVERSTGNGCGYVSRGGDAPGELQEQATVLFRFARRLSGVRTCTDCRLQGTCTRRSAGGWACTSWGGRTRCGCQLEVYGRTLWPWSWAAAARVNRPCPRGAAPEPCPWRTWWTRTRQCRRPRRTCPWSVWRKPVRTRTPFSKPSRLREYPWAPQTSWIVSTTQASAGMLAARQCG